MKKKRASIEARLGRSGFLFTLPWIIGFICFFLIPLVQSIMFSFSEVNIGVGKFNLNFIGFENFKYILCRFYCIIFFMFVNKKENEK